MLNYCCSNVVFFNVTGVFIQQGERPEAVGANQKEELENLRKQHELLKKMLEQQEQLRALQGRQEALMAMQHSAEQALAVIEDTGETGIHIETGNEREHGQ